MLAKVLALAFVAVVWCEEHGYARPEPVYEYRQRYEHTPARVQEEQASNEAHFEPAHETRYHAPAEHGHAYSSQNIVHHAGLSAYEGSQESHGEHAAPVYQYMDEEDLQAHQPVSVKQYQTIHYPAHTPAHQEHIAVHNHQPHAAIHGKPQAAVHAHPAQPHYTHGQEELNYHHGAEAHAAPVHHAVHDEAHAHASHDEPIDYYAYPKYQYEYKVEDPHTGDNKFQHEYRDGDVVKGVYGLHEADGSFRTVEYSSDKHHGFHAVVKHSAPGHHVHIESQHQN